ncbi:MAG: hypothetical protein QOD90_722 [Mycobacterium sp.]|jgi:hypothetical protein|nr:hypothetical protein [Mycobacterium sp.]
MSDPDMPNRWLIIATMVLGVAALGAFSAVAPDDLGTPAVQHSQATTR